MGQAIVYCAECQVRVRDVDVAAGRAFHVNAQTYCRTCTEARFPEALARGAAPPTSSDTGSLLKPASTRRIPVAPRRSSAVLVAVGVVSALAAVGLVVALLPGSPQPAPEAPPPRSPVQAKAPAPALPPPVPAPAAPRPGAAPAVPAREDALRPALAEAKAYVGAHPADFAGGMDRLEKIRFQAEGTPLLAEALAELEALRARFRAAVAADLKEIDAEAGRLAAAGDFRAARAVLDKARGRHAISEWTTLLNGRSAELEASAAPVFAALRERALRARREGDEEEVKRLLDQVRRWGFRKYWEDLDRALAN